MQDVAEISFEWCHGRPLLSQLLRRKVELQTRCISQLLRERKNEKEMLVVVVVVIVGRVGKQRGSVATYATFIN